VVTSPRYGNIQFMFHDVNKQFDFILRTCKVLSSL
jgi:hypothetical protein